LLKLAQERNSPGRFSFVHETNSMKGAAMTYEWSKRERDFSDHLVSRAFADKTTEN
jgi:hypothetical protein